MKAKLLLDMTGPPSDRFPDGHKPNGTLIDHPDAWKLVRMGVAEPVDEECIAKADRTPEQLAAAQAAYPRVAAGIHPDDYDAYNAGLMTGYNPDGSWIPGPNAEPEESDIWVPEAFAEDTDDGGDDTGQ